MGGFIAQHFSAKYPEMVEKLLLYSTATTFKGIKLVQDYLDTLQHPKDCGLEDRQNITGLKRQVEFCKKYDGSDIISSIKSDTLIVSGRDEQELHHEIQVKLNEAMADAVSKAQIIYLPGGHSLHREHPDSFCKTLREWFL